MMAEKNDLFDWMDSSAKGRNDFLQSMYGRGIDKELLDYQRWMNGVHDDLLEASALGFMAFYSRLPWYRKLWFKIIRWFRG
jgi:hypothetical protein